MSAMNTPPTVEPLRVQFRRQVREHALDVAQAMLLDRGWEHVTVSAVAAGVGVSRPTFYKEFASKQALGEALVRRETERFLAGIGEVLDTHTEDAEAAIAAAVRFTLMEAEADPLLRAVLTSTRGGDEALLPLLTTRSAPLLEAASAALTGWFADHYPELDAQTVAEGVDAVVRLVVSHLVLPAAPAEQTAQRLARLATRYLREP
jgi:AcrR family transcriptional regulator